MHLDMPIFKSTDPNADVMFTLWRFDVQGWLDQYQKKSMMPHICASLRGYLGRWVHSLEDGSNLTVTELLECMDHTFGDVHEYNTTVGSLYEIQKKEGEHIMNPQSHGSYLPQTGSWPKGRTWCGIDSIMDWHLACKMPWGLRW